MRRAIVVLIAASMLGGCSEIGSALSSVTAAGAAAAVGSAVNPAVGLIAGVVVSYGADQGVKYAERRIHDNVQRAIADSAGALAVGQSAAWRVPEDLPLTDRAGVVEVAREFGAAIPCKDVVFTVGDDPAPYTATVCRNGDGPWRWATAEPSVHRWETLQ
jgi:hypothetical protein